MAYVSMKVLSETLNIDAIVEESRQQWQKREDRRRGLTKWIVRLTPVGMLLMSLVFYSLSAPHTAGIINIITPGWGMFAPVGMELGILILAVVLNSGHNSRSTKWLMWTLVLLSVFINIAGGFIAVVEQAKSLLPSSMQIEGETIQSLFGRYGSLPAIYQIVLLVVVPIGVLIPLFAKTTGEFLIKMAMGRIKLETESDELRWVKERSRVVYGALFNAALKAGAGSATAGNWAQSIAERIFKEPIIEQVEATSQRRHIGQASPQLQPTMGFGAYAAQAHLGQSSDSLGQSDGVHHGSENPIVLGTANLKDTSGQGQVRLSRKDVAEWLQANGGISGKHPRELCRIYMKEKHGIDSDSGYKSFERVKKDMGLQ